MRTSTDPGELEFPSPPLGPIEEQEQRPPRRSKLVVAGAVLGSLLLIVGVIAFVLRGGEDASEPPGDEPAAVVVQAMAVPGDLEASPRSFSVTLRWTVSEGALEALVIYRDGKRLATVGPTKASFVDDTALPAVRYRYQIEAVSDGEWSPREAIGVKTPAAPPAMARLDGTYAIEANVTSAFGYEGSPNDFSSGWRFRPVCKRGPCKVMWKDAQGAGLAGALERTGARYEGSGSARLAKCGNVRSTGTFTLRLEVVRAASVREAWRATKLVGTLVERYPAQLGCVASGTNYDIIATLIA
ncbi:MAG: hypothetical protein L0206_06105 [Actinobacteria bacterium]|nr:hypothetical protein [Actinomycetota bacterium]